MKAATQKEIEDLILWRDPECREILETVCKQHGIHPDALADLVAWERSVQTATRKRGQGATFSDIFGNDQYWS